MMPQLRIVRAEEPPSAELPKLTSMADVIVAMRDTAGRISAINQRLMTVLFPDSETRETRA